MPEKYSIMDILQTHFLQKKNSNKLFFKVDMGVLEVTYNDDIGYDEGENNTCKISKSKDLSLASSPMVNSQYVLSSQQNVSIKKREMEEIKESKEHSDMGKGSQ